MQWSPFAKLLELLDRPLMPLTVRVNAIDPDVGIDQCSSASVVSGETSGGHGVQGLEGPLRYGEKS